MTCTGYFYWLGIIFTSPSHSFTFPETLGSIKAENCTSKIPLGGKKAAHEPADDSRWWWLSWWPVEVCCCSKCTLSHFPPPPPRRPLADKPPSQETSQVRIMKKIQEQAKWVQTADSALQTSPCALTGRLRPDNTKSVFALMNVGRDRQP